MNTIPAIQSALAGVQSGLQSINDNSAKIASAGSAGDITEPLVNLLRDEQQVKASAKVIEATDSIIGSILDIKV